jgi:magnesium-transporting ATPase (P-type)
MARVLAIGDGANDVAMIKAAHVGVGIAGKEGMQAVQNSDFAIGQFRFLRRLLFYHGRHNYRRLALIVYYMFYKNVLDRLCQFYFTAFALYSGQKYWSEVVTTIFNVVYTSLPIIAITIADQDVPAYVAERSAELYRAGSKQLLYTHAAFFSYVLEALVVSLVYFYAIARIFATPSSAQGSSLNVYALGIVAQFSITTVVTLRLALDVTQWTWPIVAVFAFTYLCWFGSLGLFQEVRARRRAARPLRPRTRPPPRRAGALASARLD